jgi:hypothetical protein
MMADYRNSNIANTDGSGTVNIGLANNNPGDLKCCDGNNWQGLAGNDGTFDTFIDTTWGIRAMAIDLTNKINRDGLNTITAIINAYAPAADSNDVASYISSVVSDTGLGAATILTADGPTLAELIRAIINHEIGDSLSGEYVSDQDIQTGISMMGATSPVVQAVSSAAASNPLTTVALIGISIYILARLFD